MRPSCLSCTSRKLLTKHHSAQYLMMSFELMKKVYRRGWNCFLMWMASCSLIQDLAYGKYALSLLSYLPFRRITEIGNLPDLQRHRTFLQSGNSSNTPNSTCFSKQPRQFVAGNTGMEQIESLTLMHWCLTATNKISGHISEWVGCYNIPKPQPNDKKTGRSKRASQRIYRIGLILTA